MSISTKDIRAALKNELGLNARMVSVKSSRYAISATIKVTHNPKTGKAVSFKAVKAIVDRASNVRRCQHTHTILQGNNTYTRSEFCPQAIKAMIGKDATEEVKGLEHTPGKVFEHRGVMVYFLDNKYTITAVSGADLVPDIYQRSWDANSAIIALGIAILEQEAMDGVSLAA